MDDGFKCNATLSKLGGKKKKKQEKIFEIEI